MAASSWKTLEVRKHHEQKDVCFTRAKYREGRRPKAVRVYTINLESRYLLIQGVPAVGVMTELVQLFAIYGAVEEYRVLDDYPAEQFTEVYLIKFQKLQSARIAKRKLDERSFFGGLLHVCYAPEFETVQDTREKLQDRRKFIARTTNRDKNLDRTEQKHEEPDTSKEVVNNLQQETSEIETSNVSEDWNTCTYYGYPMLPPPPQEDLQRFTSVSGNNYLKPTVHDPLFKDFTTTSTGHAANTGKHGVTEWSPPSDIRKYHGPKEVSFTKSNTSVARFIPRTTHLQDRKRRKEQVAVDSLIGIDTNDAEIFVGPKLPEEPKVDMGDDSLNVSADLIRNRLIKVSSVPALKPETKQTTEEKPPPKQRRRI
ncbi:RNA-binding protein 48 [Acipenser ruthenus]|uniref:RNA-binding protein 48 n=1 Tax=Acipenser ruthenus TaxID=7906 RepID=UPI00145AB629|nr:RNA-binding protein 48 [Acipenser ruthenus]